ncbi:hypothetical protein B0T26DRAFT_698231 [Lasiosphaeria miniovina]|uniref:Uncharacterized protein n=1 Tax=Lasiosphaeria miniovina TaxID=1954250 RepID=A0AA40B6G6_9PEZI|nr:uncharacterized protein B0T26DRAFT_698231 [Lasiosphaeria miniovina]KAK0728503.1 hypothetical protein B0T26DRAFT_698231 [Lasiosphaeria miniovina]
MSDVTRTQTEPTSRRQDARTSRLRAFPSPQNCPVFRLSGNSRGEGPWFCSFDVLSNR